MAPGSHPDLLYNKAMPSEVFILVFVLGWVLGWMFSRNRIKTANSRAEYHYERAEHYRDRLEALEKQQLRTHTPPEMEKECCITRL